MYYILYNFTTVFSNILIRKSKICSIHFIAVNDLGRHLCIRNVSQTYCKESVYALV